MLNKDDKFTIIGGGYTGLVLALYLVNNGFKNIEIFDRGDPLAALHISEIFTVRSSNYFTKLADMIGCSIDDLFIKEIEMDTWVNYREGDQIAIFEATVTEPEYRMGIIDPDTFGEKILSALKAKGVNINYNSEAIVADNGTKLIVTKDNDEICIQTDYLFDATHSGYLIRNLKHDGKPLLNDDPRICDLLGIKISGNLDSNVWVGFQGETMGPFSWIAPAKDNRVDIISSRFCYLSERDESILVERIKQIRDFTKTIPSGRIEHMEELTSEQIRDYSTMRGYYRLEPIPDIPLNAVPHIAKKGIIAIGNAAGWGDAAVSNTFFASIRNIEKLTEMLGKGTENKFYKWWRYHSLIDYDRGMAFHQSRISPRERTNQNRYNFVVSTNKRLSEKAKFIAVTQCTMSWRDILKLIPGNLGYLSELWLKTYLPFKMGYLITGGNCFGKQMNENLEPLVLTYHGFSREKRSYQR